MICQVCSTERDCIASLVAGEYYKSICQPCLYALQGDFSFSSGHQGFDRRRQYEDLAQDTVQPYNASGPNSEFYRLYPDAAEKVFTKDEIEQVKRKI